MRNPISFNSPALSHVQQQSVSSQIVSLETPLLGVIPAAELIQIFLEEIMLISPYELAQRGWVGERLDSLRIADISPEFIDLEWLQQWWMRYKDILIDIAITASQWRARANANYEDIYCGESAQFQAWGISQADLAEQLYSPCQLGQRLYEWSLVAGNSDAEVQILCCLATLRQSLSAALQLRQEGYLVWALTDPPAAQLG